MAFGLVFEGLIGAIAGALLEEEELGTTNEGLVELEGGGAFISEITTLPFPFTTFVCPK